MLSLLLFFSLLLPIARTKLNLYHTEATLDGDSLQVNCLHHHSDIGYHSTEKTEYCLGPIEENSSPDIDLLHINGKYTFDQLRRLNVTTTELLSWSATVDLAENYQDYLEPDNEVFLSGEVFINCTKPWFETQCQYSFHMDQIKSFEGILREIFERRSASEPLSGVDDLSCYIDLECDRGGAGLCLDWREVCDGRLDCLNGGVDEAQCFQLEINQCNENEYRCHNGLCISKVFLEDSILHCLDHSDLSGEPLRPLSKYTDSLISYEDVACRSDDAQFSCSDGQCVKDFSECRSNRHLLLINSISDQGHLSYPCWMMMMICLTKIPNPNNERLCRPLLKSLNITAILHTCGEVIQFPTVPVLFGHIRFLYRPTNHVNPDPNLLLRSDYLCYDPQLCEFLISTFSFEGFSCRKSTELTIDWTIRL